VYDVSLLRSNRRFRALWAVETADTLATGLADVAFDVRNGRPAGGPAAGGDE